jgi:hypothetical protein
MRYVPLLQDAGVHVILRVPKTLERLARTLRGKVEIVTSSDLGPLDFDRFCPMVSLPLALRTNTLADIPAEIPYLRAMSADIERFASLMPQTGRKHVGLVWAGERREQFKLIDGRRSTRLDNFAPIVSVTGIDFYTLQFGAPREELRTWPGAPLTDLMGEVRDMADTAAIIANLDLVVAVDTSIVHLAGALGKPVWMISRFDACWRWLEERSDSPWYPTMRIFRSDPGSLDAAIAQVATALPDFAVR